MKYTIKFRLWHWLNALVITVLALSVALRETLFDVEHNAKVLVEELTKLSMKLTTEQAEVIAKALRETLWEWHIYFGYALVALLLFRVFLVFKDQSNKEKFLGASLHKKGVKLIHFAFYIALFIISASGLALTFEDQLQIPHEKVEEIEEAHENAFYAILVFIILHIGGVVVAENRDEEGLTSRMIHGK